MIRIILVLFCIFSLSFQLSKPKVSLTPAKSTISSTSHFAATSYFEVSTVTYEDLTLENAQYLEYPMVFDTTTANVWVFAADCDKCEAITSEDATLFTCLSPCSYMGDYEDNEETYTVNGLVDQHNFNISTYKAYDTVTLGGLAATSVPFYIVEDTTASHYSGLGAIGLRNSENNILKYYYSQGKISNQIFAFYFSSQYNLLTFGYEEPYFGMEDYETYEVIDGTLAWAIPLTSVEINGIANNTYLPENLNSQFDSTLQGFGVPQSIYANFVYEIQKALGVTISYSQDIGITATCSNKTNLQTLPTIGLVFGSSDRVFTFNPSDYAKYKNGTCHIPIFTDDHLTTWVLGIPFLKAYYVVFDMDNQEIKIATKNTETSESWSQNEGLRIAVIVTGVVVAVMAVVMMLMIFKNVPVGSAPEKAD